MDYLQNFMEEEDVGTVLDLGCGDWQWASKMDWPDYWGVDVVESVIEANRVKYSNGHTRFMCRDFVDARNDEDIFGRHYDLILIKDVLMHLTDAEIEMFMKRLMNKSWRFIITANNWRYTRDPSRNGQPRNPLDNPYRWAPIDVQNSVLGKYGFKVEMFYPRGKFKQVGVLRRG